MLKVAILDDYQNIAKDFIDLKKLSSKYEFQIFNEPFENEDDAIEQLKEFEVLFIMRERTKITKNLIDQLKELKLNYEISKKKENHFTEKIDELNQETDSLLEEIDKWQM